jgi:HEAT repeat protein
MSARPHRPARTALLFALATASLAAFVAPAGAQISANQIRERYEKNTKGSNIEDFARKMNSKDISERLQAIDSFTDSKDAKAMEYLLQALGDEDMRIKAKTIDALGKLRATEATPVLIQHLFLRDTDESVKKRILAALGQIGDERAAKPIAEFLQRDLDESTRGTAIFALGEIGSPAASDALQNIEQTSDNSTLSRLAREAQAKVRYHQALLQTEAKQPNNSFLKDDQPPPQQQ